MICLTLAEVLVSSQALAVLPKINASASFDLARIRDDLKLEMKRLSEQELALIEEHGGTLSADKKTIAWTTPESEAAYIKARSDLLNHEIEIDRELQQLDGITTHTMQALLRLI